MWVKISDEDGGIYAQEAPNPIAVVTMSELEERVFWLNSQIKVATPEELQVAWDAYHGNSMFKEELEKLMIFINELKAIE
jgi:hypothetical protein